MGRGFDVFQTHVAENAAMAVDGSRLQMIHTLNSNVNTIAAAAVVAKLSSTVQQQPC